MANITQEVLAELRGTEAQDLVILEDIRFEDEEIGYWDDLAVDEIKAIELGWTEFWSVYDDEGKLRSYTAWAKTANGREYEAFSAEQAVQMEAKIAKDAIQKPLIEAGVLIVPEGIGDQVWDYHGNYYNIEGAWFGYYTEFHILNVEEGLVVLAD